MNILVIGNGGREHAIAWKLAQSPQVKQIFVAPGNGGTALENKVKNIAIEPTEIEQLIDFCHQAQIDFTVVGPELPLSLGIVDRMNAAGLACVGPTQQAAQLESSKSFCKDFLQKYHIPTAAYATFKNYDDAVHYLSTQSYPIVIKADGLAAGKGVVIAENEAIAHQTLQQFFHEKSLGSAGETVVIEAFLTGEEASFIIATDGQHYQILSSAQDHKRRDDQDKGPNTGGMGAYSPAPIADEKMVAHICQTIIEPTLKGMSDNGTPFVGFLFAGLMISPNGDPYVLEFNCRLGDPETQCILPRLKSDFALLCQAMLQKEMNHYTLEWHLQPCLGVVIAAGGYPESYQKGDEIFGLAEAEKMEAVKIFHAGTKIEKDKILTNGGRVLCVTALGDSLKTAQQQAYQAVKKIHWTNCFSRSDIGYRAIKK